MIADAFTMFFDAPAAASGTSAVVFPGIFAGRGEPINVTTTLAGPNGAAVSMVFTVQHSTDGTTWKDLATVNLTKPNAKPTVLSFALPQALQYKQLRLTYTLTGSPAGLALWSGITRDHFAPYTDGLYIDAGVVIK